MHRIGANVVITYILDIYVIQIFIELFKYDDYNYSVKLHGFLGKGKPTYLKK